MIQYLSSKIKNMIKYAVIKAFDDSGDVQKVTVSCMGKTQKAALVSPYGLIGVPIDNTPFILYNLQGQESNQVGLAFDSKNRIKGFPQGTVGLENYQTKDHILLNPDGSIQLNSASGSEITISESGNIAIKSNNGIEIETNNGIEITADTIDIEANVNIDGNLDVTGTITGTPGVDLVTHVHGGVEPGGGQTGIPQ
jgi:phage gp45-like